jgi:multidrug efflux pump subunit AcrA (membrane-fusion protein)
MRPFIAILGAFAVAAASLSAADNNVVTIPKCLLALDEESLIPAQEAGVLMKIAAREGDQVSAGDLLAQIDDAIPRMQHNIAGYKLKVAERQAADDVEYRYAVAAANCAEADYKALEEANRKSPGTVTQTELREKYLVFIKAQLGTEKAQKDQTVAALQAKVAEAELQAAKVNVEHRRIAAPIDAVVVELARHEGEWVQAGDPVMRLVRLDRLRVQGFLNSKDFRGADVQGRPVTVAVSLPGGQREMFPGKIVYVKPLVEAGGDFLVRAEVQNRKQNGVWVLTPGLNADMTIQLK